MESFNCSASPAFFLAHVAALERVESAKPPQGMSVTLPLEFNGHKLSLALLRDLANKLTVGTCVVLEHEEHSVFEVCNLGKGADAKLFYSFCSEVVDGKVVGERPLIERACDKIRAAVTSYCAADIEALKGYDEHICEELREYKYVTHTYLQRRCVAQINNLKKGNRINFNDCIDAMLEKGELLKISQAVTEKLFNISGKVYDYSALIAK